SVEITLGGCGRVLVRALDTQRVGVFEESLFQLFCELLERNAGLARAAYGLVLHIRDIHHAMHLVAAQFQVPLKQIFEDVGAEISNVRPAINGRPARVHSDWSRRRTAWLEFLNFARVGIKELQRHTSDGSGGSPELPWRLRSIAATDYFDYGDRDCGDAFALSDWAELFVSRCFNAHVGF